MTEPIKEFIAYVVQSIVDHPADIKVSVSVDEMGTLVQLNAHRDDMGQLIGKQGETMKSIRHLARIVGIKHSARVNIKLNEPEPLTNEDIERKIDEI